MTRAALTLALLTLLSVPALAQGDAAVTDNPLERRVTIHARDVALRDALDRVAVLAGVRVSYSAESMLLDQRVSLDRDDATVGDILDALLAGQRVRSLAISEDHIVLVPAPASDTLTLTRAVAVLERVVVTGSVAGAAQRPLTLALDVIDGRVVERRNASSLASVLDGSSPGLWLWEQGPSRLVAQYGSIRGASSFSLSYPKVYVDGVEVANPLLLTHVAPEQVERVEVIRGPQGAALYGADAISGVVNIVSRHGAPPDGKHAQMRSEIGWSGSAFGSTPTAVQQHGLSVRGGTNMRSGGLTLSGSTSGDYMPNAYSRELRAAADARVIGRASTFTLNARANGKRSGVPDNPLLSGFTTRRILSDSEPQALELYSLGARYQRTASERLSVSLTGGVDGYRLRNVAIESTPVPSSADTALRNASGAADRGTIRGNVVGQLGARERFGATLTLGAEKSVLRDLTGAEIPLPGPGGPLPGVSPVVRGWSHNSGVMAQTDLVVRDAVFLTAGGRLERISPTRSEAITEFLPMLGVALVRDFSTVTAKVRGAYGRGVRAPRSWAYGLKHDPRRLAPSTTLDPEEQDGTEAGLDVFVRDRFAIHVTRFDQLASGLIQTVTLVDSTPGQGQGMGRQRLQYRLQNVGEISNAGWEGSASLRSGRLTLSGVGALVESRVRRIAEGYDGDLRPGDRMLGVPERTLAMSAAWTGRGWTSAWTVSRASSWVNYDRLRIAETYADSTARAQISGANLRSYWIEYPGATRLRGHVTVDLPRGFGMMLTGENLTNEQRGEPDSITIVPGRTIMLGLRARF